MLHVPAKLTSYMRCAASCGHCDA